MSTTLQKWGNSLGLRIPKHLAESLGLDEGSEISMTRIEDSIILRKVIHGAVREATASYHASGTGVSLRDQMHALLQKHFHGDVAEMSDWLHLTYDIGFDRSDYAGILRWEKDALKFQKSLRDDWK